MEHPPGFEPKPPVNRRINIIPDHLPPSQNKRLIDQLAWKVEMEKEKVMYMICPNEVEKEK